MRFSLISGRKKNNCTNASFVPAHLNNGWSNIVSKRLFFKCGLQRNKLLMLTFLVITKILSFLFDTQDVVKVGRPTYYYIFPFISSQSSGNLVFTASFLIVCHFLSAVPPKELKYKNSTEKESRMLSLNAF